MFSRSPSFFGSESGQTRFQCERHLLLSYSSTQTHLAVAWRWFGGDTRLCLRDVACRLLQCNPPRGSEQKTKSCWAEDTIQSIAKRILKKLLDWLLVIFCTTKNVINFMIGTIADSHRRALNGRRNTLTLGCLAWYVTAMSQLPREVKG